ncbi:MAG: hypothetical protein AB4372_14915, partial [Xenococcus sp. (in: cyanobacteria)]
MNAKAPDSNKQKCPFHKLAACAGIISIFGVTFALWSLIFGRITPLPEIPVVSYKLEKFSEKKDEYNTIFIGSSRIYRHVVPSQFDNLMKSRGYN